MLKMISISLSYSCIKNPRCYFCFLKDNIDGDHYYLGREHFSNLKGFDKNTVICYEYNGYNIKDVLHCYHENEKTMTTMPLAVSKVMCGAVHKHGVNAIALSYDKEKCSSPAEWLFKAKMIKDAGMKVSCNYLLIDEEKEVEPEIIKFADQLNLLSYKPSGRLRNPELIDLRIQMYKNFLPVAVDSCIGVQLGLIDRCKAGEDFIHIMPDGLTTDCCFKYRCFLYDKYYKKGK